jgi:GT2 family glycosyltransferase
MSRISVIIPTYNRYSNIFLTLWALKNQTVQDFEVIVADDGGVDGTKNLVKEANTWGLDCKYYWHADKGYRVSLTRNQGSRLARGTHFLYLDSDVVLNPHAIAIYYELIEKHPDKVICGRYDWMPPFKVTAEDIDQWTKFAASELERLTVEHDIGYVGADPRGFGDSPVDWTDETPRVGIGTLSGNLLVPRSVFDITGGFDENIEGRGQDGEFGRNISTHNIQSIACQRVHGYHLNHARDRIWETKSVRETIKYIHKKYNLPLNEDQLPKVETYEKNPA